MSALRLFNYKIVNRYLSAIDRNAHVIFPVRVAFSNAPVKRKDVVL